MRVDEFSHELAWGKKKPRSVSRSASVDSPACVEAALGIVELARGSIAAPRHTAADITQSLRDWEARSAQCDDQDGWHPSKTKRRTHHEATRKNVLRFVNQQRNRYGARAEAARLFNVSGTLISRWCAREGFISQYTLATKERQICPRPAKAVQPPEQKDANKPNHPTQPTPTDRLDDAVINLTFIDNSEKRRNVLRFMAENHGEYGAYSEAARRFNISSGTVSHWCRDIIFASSKSMSTRTATKEQPVTSALDA